MKCKCGNENKFNLTVYATRKELRCHECGKYIKFITKEEYSMLKGKGLIKFEETK